MISYIMNTKNCMSVLLLSDRFDSFSFIGGEITTYCTFQIDGTYHPEFFADKEDAGSEPYVRAYIWFRSRLKDRRKSFIWMTSRRLFPR